MFIQECDSLISIASSNICFVSFFLPIQWQVIPRIGFEFGDVRKSQAGQIFSTGRNQPGLTQRDKWFCRTRCLSLTKGPIVVPTLFFLFLGISGGQLAIVFCSWNFMIGPIWNNFSHRERNLKSGCHPKNIFFSTDEPFFEKDRWALEPTASVKILYTTLDKSFLRQRDKRADRKPIFFYP